MASCPILCDQRCHTLTPYPIAAVYTGHMRPECDFYPAINLNSVVDGIPDGSDVMTIFGEIDCREGIIDAVERCYHDVSYNALANHRPVSFVVIPVHATA